MCGRFAITFDSVELAEAMKIGKVEFEFSSNYNVAPQSKVPIITWGSRIERGYRWGLIPHWAKDPNMRFKTINARGETVHEKPMYREAFKRGRVLIPVSGFYEWKRTGKEKIPHYITLKKRKIYPMAGVASTWKDKNGEEIRTCSIVTIGPNKMMKDIHDRMPVILDEKDEDTWMNPESDLETVKKLIKPYAASKMQHWEVSTEVNNPRNKGTELILEHKREQRGLGDFS